MKIKYLTITFSIILASFINLKAEETSCYPSAVSIISVQDNEEWFLVIKDENLTIYLKEEVLTEGRFVTYKFENSSSKEISFSWDVIQNKNIVQENNGAITIKASSIEIFFDPTVSIQLKENETVQDFSLIIKY